MRLGKRVKNNQVEAMTFFQGLKIFYARKIRSLIAIVDSAIIIKMMHNSSSK
jgi:hypothetical protein